MNYADWVKTVPREIQEDALWQQEAYRLSFRARFYEYALGSGRESRTWYFDARHVLGETVSNHRIRLHTQIIRLLLSMLPLTRGYALHKGDADGPIMTDDASTQFDSQNSTELLQNVPIPES